MEYIGVKCPVCEMAFKKNDDIVVCPTCGAPYHRNCYKEKGECIFDKLHASGKTWAPPDKTQNTPPDVKSEIKDQECPACGTLNSHSASFCNRCGTQLSKKSTDESKPPLQQGQTNQSNLPPVNSFGNPVSPFTFDPMGGVSPTDRIKDNVTFGELSKLVKQNTAYYMSAFRYMKQSGKNKFNFCAFLCSGPWMLYRKQYKSGAIVTIIIFILYMAYVFSSLFLSSPLLLQLYSENGMDASKTYSFSSPQMTALSQQLIQDPFTFLKISVPIICLLFIFIVMLIIGIRGNKMYMKHCVETIESIKSNSDNPDSSDINKSIDSKGGVNIAIGISMFICYALIANVPYFL